MRKETKVIKGEGSHILFSWPLSSTQTIKVTKKVSDIYHYKHNSNSNNPTVVCNAILSSLAP